jgi:hypothetical protein
MSALKDTSWHIVYKALHEKQRELGRCLSMKEAINVIAWTPSAPFDLNTKIIDIINGLKDLSYIDVQRDTIIVLDT